MRYVSINKKLLKLSCVDECFNAFKKFMYSVYNLNYMTVSNANDLINLPSNKEIINYGQFKFFDYSDGGIVDVFMYVYRNKDGSLSCCIDKMVYR